VTTQEFTFNIYKNKVSLILTTTHKWPSLHGLISCHCGFDPGRRLGRSYTKETETGKIYWA